MDELGAFTPAQAQALWQDYLSRKQLPAHQTQHYPQRRPVHDVSPHRVYVRNTEAETIPPYACMRITGVEDVNGVTALKVEKPSATSGHFLFNGPYEIQQDVIEVIEGEDVITRPGVGWGYRHGVVLMLGKLAEQTDAPPSQVGAAFSPIVNSWEIEEAEGPFTVFGKDLTNLQTLVGRIEVGGEGGGDFAIALPTGEPVPGIGFTCDAVEATIITTSCNSRFQPGDVIYIWDLCRNWLNMPVELLTQTTFNVQYVKIHEDEYNRPESLTGTCRWVVTGMCCVESSVYEY